MPDTPRILLHNSETGSLASWLHAAHPKADFAECNSYEALPALVASYRPDIVYSVRFAGTLGYPRDALLGPDGPRWIANGGAGTDHFGIWDPDKVTVTNAAGVAADMMAEYVFGGFLHFTLDIPGLEKDKAGQVWRDRTVAPLFGRTLLIVGLGHTGRAIAARAKAFGMHVIGTRSTPRSMQNVDQVHPASGLKELLPRADFVAICTPLTPQTTKLMGAEEFDAVKRGAILADVSRGGVVDQTALLRALQSKQIAAAVLDVFEAEPLPQAHPLWTAKNVVISPHCSSVYDGWEEASFNLFLENLELWLNGKELVNVVDPARGY